MIYYRGNDHQLSLLIVERGIESATKSYREVFSMIGAKGLLERFAIALLSVAIVFAPVPWSQQNLFINIALAQDTPDEKPNLYEIIFDRKLTDEEISKLTPDEIKSQYRAEAMKCHPDRHPGDLQKEARFKSLADAYGFLSDPAKRAIYDQAGRPSDMEHISTIIKNEEMKLPNRWQTAKGMVRNVKGAPAGLVLFMFLSTFVEWFFAKADRTPEGQEKADELKKAFFEPGAWLGFTFFESGTHLTQIGLALLLGSKFVTFKGIKMPVVRGAHRMGTAGMAVGMFADHLFRKWWDSAERRNYWKYRTETIRLKKMLYLEEDKLKKMITGECDVPLAAVKESCRARALEQTELINRIGTELEERTRLQNENWQKSHEQIFFNSREQEELTHTAGSLLVTMAVTNTIMRTVMKAQQSALGQASLSLVDVHKILNWVYSTVKSLPNSLLPSVFDINPIEAPMSPFRQRLLSILGRGASLFRNVFKTNPVGTDWKVRNDKGRLLWGGSSGAAVRNTYSHFLRTIGNRTPGLLLFLSVNHFVGSGPNVSQFFKSLQLLGIKVSGSPRKNITAIIEEATDLLKSPRFKNFVEFDQSMEDYEEDWDVWRDAVVFSQVNEILQRYEKKAQEARLESGKLIGHMHWFFDSAKKFGVLGKLDFDDPQYRANNYGGFEWHPPTDNGVFGYEFRFQRHFEEHYWDDFTVSGSRFFLTPVGSEVYLTGDKLKERIERVRLRFLIDAEAQLKLKLAELEHRYLNAHMPMVVDYAINGNEGTLSSNNATDPKLDSEILRLKASLTLHEKACRVFKNPESCKILEDNKLKLDIEILERDQTLAKRQEEVTGRGVVGTLMDKFTDLLIRGETKLSARSYVSALKVQYEALRSTFYKISGLQRTPLYEEFDALLKRCPNLQGVTSSDQCSYVVADFMVRYGGYNIHPLFSFGEEFDRGLLKGSSADYFYFPAGVVSPSPLTIRRDAGFLSANDGSVTNLVVWNFMKSISHVATQFLLLPVIQRNRSRIEHPSPQPPEFYIDPMDKRDFDAANDNPGYSKFKSVDIFRVNLARELSIPPPPDLKPIPEHVGKNHPHDRLVVNLSDLKQLNEMYFIKTLDYRMVRIVNPDKPQALKEAEVKLNTSVRNQDAYLESYKNYLKVRYSFPASPRMIVKEESDLSRRLKLRKGDIIYHLDTIQSSSIRGIDQRVELGAEVFGTGDIKAWLMFLEANKYPEAAIHVLRTRPMATKSKVAQPSTWKNFLDMNLNNFTEPNKHGVEIHYEVIDLEVTGYPSTDSTENWLQ